jgi:hypothetical protein
MTDFHEIWHYYQAIGDTFLAFIFVAFLLLFLS